MRRIIISLGILSLSSALHAGENPSDRTVLEGLYNATDGVRWRNKTGWPCDRPPGGWYGVTAKANGRVTHLTLRDNRLTGELPSSLGELSNLQALMLFRICLSSESPASIGKRTDLQTLWIGHNQSSGLLPSSMVNLKNLREFGLSDTQLCAPADEAFRTRQGGVTRTSGGGGQAGSELVIIPDSKLRAAIEDILGEAGDASITRAAMGTLARIEAPNSDISDLTGLQFATGLTRLNLFNNDISDVSPLAELTGLLYLNLEFSNDLSDITPLSGLTNLKELHLEATRISDISSLAGLSDLTVLRLHNTRNISDISSLAGLTNLTILSLRNNRISDISSLSGLARLKVLNLGSNRISDLSPLSGLTELTWLHLNDNRISDLSPLVANPGLSQINVRENPLNSNSINTHIPALRAKGVSVTR